MGKNQQLALQVGLDSEASLANFICTNTATATLVEQLRCPVGCHFLWGERGSGITHLLVAAGALNDASQYLDLQELCNADAEILAGLPSLNTLAIDNLQSIAGNAAWQEALFHLFNRQQAAGAAILFGAHQSPTELTIELADLRSRALSGMVWHLPSLDDDALRRALKLKAATAGLDLDDAVVEYICRRAPRSMSALSLLVKKLDNLSLQQKKRVTVPMASSLFHQEGTE